MAWSYEGGITGSAAEKAAAEDATPALAQVTFAKIVFGVFLGNLLTALVIGVVYALAHN